MRLDKMIKLLLLFLNGKNHRFAQSYIIVWHVRIIIGVRLLWPTNVLIIKYLLQSYYKCPRWRSTSVHSPTCAYSICYFIYLFFFTEAIAILFLLFNIVVQSTQSWDIMTIYKYIYIFYYNRTFIIIVIGDSFVIKYYDWYITILP